MNFSSFSVILSFLCLSLVGFALLPLLSIQWLPSAGTTSLVVNCNWAGASPEVFEQEVITPLEGAFSLVEGVKRIYSVARSGRGSIQLEMSPEVNRDFFRFEIASKVRQIYPKLPAGVSFPVIQLNNPEKEETERPILSYTLSGEAMSSELFRYANEVLRPQFAILKDVENIEVVGGNSTEIRITYQSALLAQLDVTTTDLLQALSTAYAIENLGTVQDGTDQLTIRLNNTDEYSWNDNLALKEQLLTIPITKKDGKIIRLGELAMVSFEEQPATQFYRINGKNSIRLLFYAVAGANTIKVAQNCESYLTNGVTAITD